ncbi:MAG TPA: MFS transporter [Steroidobacteraceae bacterium]|nr:MFS transporter [Steroidobacteraceae bacterium]
MVLLLFLANVANYGQRMMVAILLPAIKTEVVLTDGQLGLLMGGGFALFHAIAGVPLARFADRRGRVKWLSIAIVFWSAATALFGFTRTFLQMLTARMALGVGQSICIPTSHSLLTDYVTAENRPFALGVHSTGAVLGATLALILGGYLEVWVGWRQALMLAAFSGFALALLLFATLREPPRTGSAGSPDNSAEAPLRAVVSHLFSLRSYRLVLVAVCFAMLVEYGLNQWLPSYYVRQFSLSMSDVGFRYGLAVALGGIPGSILGGWLATILTRRDIRWLVWFPGAMYIIALPVGLSMLLVAQASTALLLNGLYAFAIFTTNGALWAACFVHVSSSMRATTSALTLMFAGITGLALGPALVGGISDAFISRAGTHSLQQSLVLVECLAVGVIVPLLLAGRCIAREHRIHAHDELSLSSASRSAPLKEPV